MFALARRRFRSFSLLTLAAGAGLLLGAASASRASDPGPAKPKPSAPAPPASTGVSQTPSDEDSGQASWFAGGQELYVPPYYDTFKGLDITTLTPAQRERFIHWVNTEFCTCAQTGCQRDTIANCYTNDSACPRAPNRIREILAKVQEPAPPAVPAPPAPVPPAK